MPWQSDVNSSGKNYISEKIRHESGVSMDVRIIDINNKRKFGESRRILCMCVQRFCAFVVLVTISYMQRLFLCVGSYSPDIYMF